MPVRLPSDTERTRLSSWPNEIADDDLVTYSPLTSDDLGWLGVLSHQVGDSRLTGGSPPSALWRRRVL
jgi:hypothetical protein